MKCYACGKLGHISRLVFLERTIRTFTDNKSVTVLRQMVVLSTLLARPATSAVRPAIFLET
jgi:hypothetical protein